MESNDIFNNLMNYSSSKPSTNVVSTVKKSDRLLENIKSQGFNMDQLGDVIKTKGNQLIISIAGSGKTTALIFKIMYDITTGEATRMVTVNGNDIKVLDKIWVCTFLKTGADELKAKLALWQRKMGLMDTSEHMSFSTLHAEFKRALTAMGVNTNIIDSSVNSKNLKSVTERYAIQYEGKPLNGDMLKDLEGALTYTRNRLDSKRYSCDIYNELEIGPTIVDTMLRDWKQMRRDLGCVDFEDLQEILYEECYLKNNLEVINFLASRYNYIYVDEFQDTSQIQYALLKVYSNGVKKIVAIGDDDQTIYSWRGSYNKIITEEFPKDFKPTISKLSVNYRCPWNILKAVKPSLELNEGRFKKELKSFNEGGELRVGYYHSYGKMAQDLADMIYEDVKNNRTVAVLCRVNSDGLLPALMLDNIGKFQYSVSGDGMTFDSYIGKSVINIAKLFTEKSSPAVKSTLSQLTWNKYSVNNIMKVCKNNKVSFWEIPDKDLAYSCPDIYETLKVWKSWRESMGEIRTLQLIYQYFRTSVLARRDSNFNTVFKSVIQSVETLLDFTKAETVEDFLEELEDINERLKARKRKYNGSKVRIATIHEFKGKEADSVYIWNDSVDVFPHKECNLDDVEELEEERRVHYIACTRARKINTIMTIKLQEGMFFKEMDLSGATILHSKVSGELAKGGSKDVDLDKLIDKSDEEVISFNGLSKNQGSVGGELLKSFRTDAVEVDPEDRIFIRQMYDEGKDGYEILTEMEINGYDVYTYADIMEVIDEYENYKKRSRM